MIKVKFIKNENNFVGVDCSGHAGYADMGADIVCAAVSSLVQNVEIALSEVLNINLNVNRNDKNAKLFIKLPKNVSSENLNKSQILFLSLKISLERIENQYKKYLKVEVENEIL